MVRGVAPCGCDGADERVGDKGDADADRMRKEGCQDEASATDEPLEGDAGGEQGEGPYQGAEAGRARPGGQQTPQAQRSAAKGLLRTCRGEAWPIAASTAVLSMRRAASAEETRPLRNQVRVVRALAAMRGDKRIVYRAEWEASWVDMDTSLRIGPGRASA